MVGHLAWLSDVFRKNCGRTFMIHEDAVFSYAWLIENIDRWKSILDKHQVTGGTISALRGDFSPGVVSALLALVDRGAIIVPLSPAAAVQEAEFMEIAEAGLVCSFTPDGSGILKRCERRPQNSLSLQLIRRGHPGLILFTSGSTGKSKAALHDFLPLLEKFKTPRRGMITLPFLMIDHIGGINTLLYVISNGGTVVVTSKRDPHSVCAAIARHKVELLPASPTFLNLLILSEAYHHYDLSSLQLITYGTEMMPQYTLERIASILPHVRLQQTYGLSELGILRSKSANSNSLWVKVGGEGYQTKVKDGTLWIRAESAMLGYLNDRSPFDEEGWFNTGDMVEVQGEYFRFLGRCSEIINVGGQKVYPAEVENVLMELPNVRDVTVTGEPNPVTGNIVVARFNLMEFEELPAFRRRVRGFCRGRLEAFKVPVRIEVLEMDQFSSRFKKMRRRTGE